jgi:RNA polymerase sigma factor (sigma-70 family)
MLSGDRQLASRCRLGDGAAFAELAHTHRVALYRTALGILRCADLAEDVVQEALIRAYQASRRLDPDREPLAWLRAIVVRCALTACRSEARRAEFTARLGRCEQTRQAAAPGGDGATARFEAAVEALSPMQRAVLTLSAVEDLTLAEAARVLGCSVGTAKKHLHRARERVRSALNGHTEEE